MDERALELKTMIEEKNEELLKEIAQALSNNDYESYNYLKSLQLHYMLKLEQSYNDFESKYNIAIYIYIIT